MMANDIEFLERGDIYFAYRPKVEEPEPGGVEEIQRLFVLLQPGDGPSRRLVVGRKQLPEESEHERFWGFVDEVSRAPEEVEDELERDEYQTRTRGTRVQWESRPAGEGVYGVVRHGNHNHLVYALELPEEPGEVQRELGIDSEASYVMSLKNPETSSPPGVGLSPSQRPDLPEELQARFGNRRFAPAEPELLDVEGMEFVLIGAAEDPGEELGVELAAEDESEATADIFRRLRLPPEDHPTEPLTEGEWR